jgi:hypothetical protein
MVIGFVFYESALFLDGRNQTKERIDESILDIFTIQSKVKRS